MSQQPSTQSSQSVPPSQSTTTTTPTGSQTQQFPTLILRAASSSAENRHIAWAEDVIDNEGLGKKSSKVCCIYHAPHAPGDSSDDESSSSDDSDSDASSGKDDDGRARPAGGAKAGRKGRRHGGRDHEHGEGDGCGGGGNGEGSSGQGGRGAKRRASPNAYEKVPRHKDAKQGGGGVS